MSNLNAFIDFTKKWEGGLSRDVHDSASAFTNPMPYQGKTGWHTNKGITYQSWFTVFGKERAQAFFLMSDEDWLKVFKNLYWDKVSGDKFESFGVAAYVTGMAWGSGAKKAGELLQQALNNLGKQVKVDGNIGPATIAAANECDAQELFDEMLKLREAFFRKIAAPGSKNAKFLNGWLNRLEAYRTEFRPTKP